MGFDYSKGVSRSFLVQAERVQICSFLLVSRPPWAPQSLSAGQGPDRCRHPPTNSDTGPNPSGFQGFRGVRTESPKTDRGQKIWLAPFFPFRFQLAVCITFAGCSWYTNELQCFISDDGCERCKYPHPQKGCGNWYPCVYMCVCMCCVYMFVRVYECLRERV